MNLIRIFAANLAYFYLLTQLSLAGMLLRKIEYCQSGILDQLTGAMSCP